MLMFQQMVGLFFNNYIISPCQERLQFNARRMYGRAFLCALDKYQQV